MALSNRQEFDLDGAADYLGCSASDILYYLDKGLLRLAVSTSHVPDLISVPLNDLPLAQQQHLKSLYNPDGIDLHRITEDPTLLDGSVPVTCMYLTHHQRNKIKDTVHALGEPIWIFQNLLGEQITVWSEGRLRAFWLFEEGGWIADTHLVREELDRLVAGAGNDKEVNTQRKEDSLEAKEGAALFDYPNLADGTARLMVEHMNQFIRENHRAAGATELCDFIVERITYINYDHRDKQIQIGDEEDRPKYLSFKDFKRRYQRYFDPN